MEIPKQLHNKEYKFTILKGKIPQEKNWQNENNYSFDAKILEIHKDNIGVVCGKGGLFVIDIDGNPLQTLEKIYEFLPKTYTVKTGKQGFHLYYHCDELIQTTAFEFNNSHIDIKADRGQVVMEGSIHPDTKRKYLCYYDENIQSISKKDIETFFGFKQEKGFTKKIKSNNEKKDIKITHKDDESRSAIEYSHVCSLISKGKTKDQIYDLMNAFQKWASSDYRYRDYTYNKALNFIETSRYEPVDETNIKYRVYSLLSDKNKDTSYNSYLEAQEVLIEFLKSKLRFRTIMQDEKNEIWAYNEGIYENKGMSLIREELRKILEKDYTEKFYKQILNKITADTYISANDFFKKEEAYLLPLENGILDIKNMELLDFTPNYVFFSKLPVKYDPKSDCPNIKNHLKTSLKNEDDILLFQEALGNCLIKNYKFQKAVMFVGSGRNGKGITLEIIKNFLGQNNTSAITLEQIENDVYALSELHGKFANIGGDLNSTSLKKTGLFKSASGGDLLSAPRKFLSPINFSNYAKFFFACNSLPRIYDDSRGFWERWLYFEFPYTFIPQEEYDLKSDDEKKNYKIANPLISDKLLNKEELNGLLIFALEGLKRLMKDGCFSDSTTFTEVKRKWINQSDSFKAFCEVSINTNFDEFTTKDDIKKHYYKYCKNNDVRPLSDKHIYNILTTDYGAEVKQSNINGITQRVWWGIELK